MKINNFYFLEFIICLMLYFVNIKLKNEIIIKDAYTPINYQTQKIENNKISDITISDHLVDRFPLLR